MPKRIGWYVLAVGFLMAAPTVSAQSTITCGPLDDGRVANVYYKTNAIFFEPIVEYEFEAAVLTISGPCEDIVRTFKPGEDIVFDLAEVQRVLDGSYDWELRFMPAVDPGVRKELQASRGSGEEDDLWWNLWQKGAIPDGPRVDSAGFTVVNGAIIDPGSGEERQKSATVASKRSAAPLAAAVGGFDTGGSAASEDSGSGSGDGGNPLATKDFVINDDLIVIGSTCIGFDCVSGEVFSFDTLRFKENNLRIKFQDTSGGSFPSRDWEVEVNSSANGGQSHFRINDVDGARSPFTIEAAAPSHSLYVDSSGRIGSGTSNPIVEVHVANGDTPTLRLDQNTSSGFQAQVWDVAGNETNFFVRDVTGGSRLPFRIRPGAPTSSIDVANTGNVGIGTSSPAERLHVLVNTDANIMTAVENNNTGTSAAGVVRAKSDIATVNFQAHGSGRTLARFGETLGGWGELLHAAGNGMIIGTLAADPLILGTNNTNVLEITPTGNVLHMGSQVHPDYVFEPDYPLESIEEHAAYMWEKRHLPAVGAGEYTEDGRAVFDLGNSRAGMLEELEKAHIYIDQLNQSLKQKEALISNLVERLENLESQMDSP